MTARRVVLALLCVATASAMIAYPLLAGIASCIALAAVARAGWTAARAPERIQ